jgi:5-methylcytosine-specific restriction endonuclease McrA
VLREAGVGSKENKATGRWAKHYRCSHCGNEYPSTGVAVDHIEPVVGVVEGFVSWDVFIERLFCPKENLQVLCTACHKAKTATEREDRKCLKTETPKKNSSTSRSKTSKT